MLAGLGLLPFGLDAHIAIVALLFVDGEFEFVHDTQGHGPPNRFNKTERNFSAGPNFIFNECIKWSSVSNGKPVPSMHCSRKFCK